MWVKDTMNDNQFIGEIIFSEVFMYIDVAYALHGNIRSHTGGAMSMGYGIIHEKVWKQKITVKILTEA